MRGSFQDIKRVLDSKSERYTAEVQDKSYTNISGSRASESSWPYIMGQSSIKHISRMPGSMWALPQNRQKQNFSPSEVERARESTCLSKEIKYSTKSII